MSAEVRLTMVQLQSLVNQYTGLEVRMARLEGACRVLTWLVGALLTGLVGTAGGAVLLLFR